MIRVLVVDDQPLVRAGLRGILRPEYGFEVVGECGVGAAALEAVVALTPDVVLLDVRMPVMDGVEATRRLAERPGCPPVLVLTTFDDDGVLSAALRAGASGFLLKDAAAEDIQGAVRAVAGGGAWLDPAVTGRVLAGYRLVPRDDALDRLTARERQVLGLVGRGATNAEIAAELVVSEATVKTHIGSIFSKLALRDRAAAVVFAFDHGLVSAQGGA